MCSRWLWCPHYSKCLTSFVILTGKENCLPTVMLFPKLFTVLLLYSSSTHLQLDCLLLVNLLYLRNSHGMAKPCHSGLRLGASRVQRLGTGADDGMVTAKPSNCSCISEESEPHDLGSPSLAFHDSVPVTCIDSCWWTAVPL